MRQRAAAIAQQSRTATGVIVQKLDENDGIKDVALVPELDEEFSSATGASASGSGGSGGVAETLRGGGGGDGGAVAGEGHRHAEQEREEGGRKTGLAWMASVVRDVLNSKAR